MRTTFSMVMLCSLSLALAAAMPCARADGAGIALNGNARGVPACMTCHGAQGEGTAATGFPRLAGLDAGYVHAQLEAFAVGKRTNAMMTPIAQALNAVERKQLADYYSGLGRAPGTVKATTQQGRQGRPKTRLSGRAAGPQAPLEKRSARVRAMSRQPGRGRRKRVSGAGRTVRAVYRKPVTRLATG